MNNELKIFAERLRILRIEKGWSQEELATKMGCAKSLISYYENCKREPVFTTILKLSRLFDEDPGYLMGESHQRRLKKMSS